jgi:hypothetical protein
MGYGDHSDLHDHGPDDRDHVDVRTFQGRQKIINYISSRLGSSVGERDTHKDVAREVSSIFGVTLTPGEVKDIHCSGW